jgi:hypothetical protein
MKVTEKGLRLAPARTVFYEKLKASWALIPIESTKINPESEFYLKSGLGDFYELFSLDELKEARVRNNTTLAFRNKTDSYSVYDSSSIIQHGFSSGLIPTTEFESKLGAFEIICDFVRSDYFCVYANSFSTVSGQLEAIDTHLAVSYGVPKDFFVFPATPVMYYVSQF